MALRRNVAAEVDAAARFRAHADALRGAADFYNAFGARVPACQKPMLLAEAVEFERVRFFVFVIG